MGPHDKGCAVLQEAKQYLVSFDLSVLPFKRKQLKLTELIILFLFFVCHNWHQFNN